MPPSVRQTSFSAGELSPLIRSRTDLPSFAKGASTLRNFFVSQLGSAVSRPGSEYVATSKAVLASDGTPRGHGKGKVVPFNAGEDVSYVLLFGELYLRFFSQGEQVRGAHGVTPYEIVTPYESSELSQLKYAQTGDVLTLVHPNHPPMELRISAPASWSLTLVNFVPPPPWFEALDAQAPLPPTLPYCLCADLGGGILPPDADHPAQEWQWNFTVLVKDKSTGATYETLPQTVVTQFLVGVGYDNSNQQIANGNMWALYSDRPITLKRPFTAQPRPPPPPQAANYDIIAYNCYRGRGGLFGFVGQTASDTFVDVGDAPDYATQPPIGTLPFEFAGDNPSCVAFFQERRGFAGSVDSPETAKLSKTGDYANFDSRVLIHVSGESLTFTLAARKREDIKSMLTRQRLLMFTGSSVWSVGGTQGSPIDFDDIDARLEDETGATDVQPIVADGAALYVRAKGIGVRALIADGQQYAYKGVDLSLLAQHLFVGANRDIIDWCYAQDPQGLVWAVRADGMLLSLTYSQDMWGWARHDTDGTYESICTVPEDDEDAVYAIVKRTVNGAIVRYVERFTSRVLRYPSVDDFGNALPDPTYPLLWPDNLCVDSALEYTGAPTTQFTGLGTLEGKEVWVIARGLDPSGPWTVTGGTISGVYGAAPAPNALDSSGTPIFAAHVGLPFTAQLETLDIAGGQQRLTKKTTARVGIEVDSAAGIEYGQDFDHLDEWVQRDVDDDGFDGINLQTTIIDVTVASNIDQSARAVVQQANPLPVTIVGLTRVLALGE